MQIQVGKRLVSVVDTTAVIATRVPDGDVSLTCGGAEMVLEGTDFTAVEADAGQQGGSLLGKRYVDEAGTIEVLCVKGGEGSLALNGAPLDLQSAKPLPSSD